MTTQIEVATGILFPSEGNQAANIKFYGGWNRVANGEAIAAEFVRVEQLVIDQGIQPELGIGD